MLYGAWSRHLFRRTAWRLSKVGTKIESTRLRGRRGADPTRYAGGFFASAAGFGLTHI